VILFPFALFEWHGDRAKDATPHGTRFAYARKFPLPLKGGAKKRGGHLFYEIMIKKLG
jgi:hypothetical protein